MHRPSALWYAFGSLLIIGCLVAGVAGLLHDVAAFQKDFVRFVMPGATDLHITKPGVYELYYERQSVIDNETFSTPAKTDINCSLTRNGSSEPIPVDPVTIVAEYHFADRAGKAIAEFSAPAAGTYVLSCAYPSGSGPRVAMAVGPPIAADTIASMFKWLAVVFVGLGAGMIVLIVTLVRRAGPARPPPIPPL